MDGQGLDPERQREPPPDLIQVHRIPPIDSNPQLSHAEPEEDSDRLKRSRDRRLELLRELRNPLPPGDWDWEVIRPHFPARNRPDDSLLMPELELGNDPSFHHRP